MKLTFKFYIVLFAFLYIIQAASAQSFCLQTANNDQLGSVDNNKTITFPLSALQANDSENLPLASFTSTSSGSLLYDATTMMFTYTPAPGFAGPVSFTYNLKREPETRLGTPFMVNGEEHFYEQIQVQPNITWQDAMMQAAKRSYNGKKGYLATITSAAENEHLRQILTTMPLGQLAWLGGSDAAVEGTFKWVTGPEAASLFTYNNWVPGEPNNIGGEDYVTINTRGLWNDLSNTGDAGAGFAPNLYLVEYGSAENCDLGLIATATINVTQPDNPGSNCTLALNTSLLQSLQANPTYLINAVMNGTASLNKLVTGGTAPLAYNLSQVEALDVANYKPGLYNFSVTDATGCSVKTTIYLGTLPHPLVLLLSPTDASAPGTNDGAVDLTVIGLLGPYTFEWSNGTMTEDLNGIPAGEYWVIVSDRNGATDTAWVTVGGGNTAGMAGRKSTSGSGDNKGGLKDAGLLVYPNPMKGQSTTAFQMPENGNYQLALYDMQGTLVQRIASGQARQNQVLSFILDSGTYTNGVYVLKLVTNKGSSMKRLIIQH